MKKIFNNEEFIYYYEETDEPYFRKIILIDNRENLYSLGNLEREMVGNIVGFVKLYNHLNILFFQDFIKKDYEKDLMILLEIVEKDLKGNDKQKYKRLVNKLLKKIKR